jgi:hypothetical protein
MSEEQKDSIFVIPLANGTDHVVSMEDIKSWELSFPGVDIQQALRTMREWCLSNPTKRKTPKGVRRFITNWLTRDQDGGRNRRVVQHVPDPNDNRPAKFPFPN